MRWLAGILLLVLIGMQYRLWVGPGSLADVQALEEEIAAQKAELVDLRTRNQTLEAEVLDLREGLDAIQERARSELGMIKQGEIFLQVIGEQDGTGAEPRPDGQVDDGELARSRVTADAGRER